MNLFDISGRVILVTGAGRGNGRAIAQGLTMQGATVCAIDKQFPFDDAFHQAVADVTDENGLIECIDRCSDELGAVDGLINNAGISLASKNPYQDNNVYDDTLAVNLNAVFRLTSHVCKAMADNGGGSIVNITSLGAELGFPMNPSYQIAKGGLAQLTKAFAYDWGAKNIRVNNICPGYIKTDMTMESFKNEDLRIERQNRTMLQRWGESSDLVGAATFLLSDASAYVTGTTIHVDGGWTAKGL
jgi:NAD(P)-dependent dehydrogenase (short-subunit alcohol dehydrogenase family)